MLLGSKVGLPAHGVGEQNADPTNAGEMQKNRRVEFRDGGAARFRKRALQNRHGFAAMKTCTLVDVATGAGRRSGYPHDLPGAGASFRPLHTILVR